MPSLDGSLSFTGRLIPAENLARITVTDNNSPRVSWVWTIKAGSASENRWKTLGIPPVVWYWLPPSIGWVGPLDLKDSSPKDAAFRLEHFPTLQFRRPLLLIALARDATVRVSRDRPRFTRFSVKQPQARFPKGSASEVWARGTEGTLSCDLTPEVTVYRIQDPHAMPSFDDPASIVAAMGSPFALAPQRKDTARPRRTPVKSLDPAQIEKQLNTELAYVVGGKTRIPATLLIVPHPNGVVIQHSQQQFQVQITINNMDEPAAYAYLADIVNDLLSVIVIDHDSNVTVTIQAGPAASRRGTLIYSRQLKHEDVPRQGAVSPPGRKTYKQYKKHELPDPTSILSLLQLIIEVPLSFVPVVGDLYELGQLAFMAATGRDFWGQKVSSNEILVYGALALLSVGMTGAARGAARAGRSARLEAQLALLEELTTDLRRIADDADAPSRQARFLKPIKDLAAPQQNKLSGVFDELAGMLDEVVKNPGAAKRLDVAGDLAKSVQKAVFEARAAAKFRFEELALLDVKALLSEDMTSFVNPMLRWEYDDYLVLAKWENFEPKAPLDWLLGPKPRQWVDAYLKAHLGPKWRTVIQAAYGRLPHQRTLTHEMLLHYDTIQNIKGIGNYRQMQKLVRKFSGFGFFFELDHIIEQRFIRRLREWTEAVPEDIAFQVFLVPKNATVADDMVKLADSVKLDIPHVLMVPSNAGVAAEMINDSASHTIKYVHDAKTDIMRTLIPYGSEHLFNTQQIADATLFALKSLDAHKYMTKIEVLEEDFRFLAKALGDKDPWRLRPWDELTEDLFTVAKGWPQVK